MGTEDTLVTGHHRFPAGCQRVGRRHHFWQRDLCASGYSGSMTDEGGHKISQERRRFLLHILPVYLGWFGRFVLTFLS